MHSSGPTVLNAQQLPHELWFLTGVHPPESHQLNASGRSLVGVQGSNLAPASQFSGAFIPQSSSREYSVAGFSPTVKVQPSISPCLRRLSISALESPSAREICAVMSKSEKTAIDSLTVFVGFIISLSFFRLLASALCDRSTPAKNDPLPLRERPDSGSQAGICLIPTSL